MKKNKYFLLLISAFIVLASCKESKKGDFKSDFENKEGFEVISINNSNKVDNIKESEFIKSVDFIRLETNENCLIGKIDKIHVDSSHIYILDGRKAKSLFVFKRNGEFVQKVGRKGKGPGEYTNIRDFTVLDDGTVVLFDFSTNKLLFYENFVFKNSQKMFMPISSFETKDSYYYFKLLKLGEKESYDLMIADNSFRTINEEFLTPPNSKMQANRSYDFRTFNDSLSFIRFYENKIYRLKENKVIPKFYFDFGIKQLSYNDVYFINGRDWKGKNFLMSSIFETETFIYFKYVDVENIVCLGLYNKKTKETKHSKKSLEFDVSKNCLSFYINSNANSIIGELFFESLEDIDVETKEEFGLIGVKETDNPVISISYF